MAIDFVSALVDAWAADAALAAAGIGTLHEDVDVDSGYPFAVVTGLGERKPLRTFGKGQVHEQHIRINVFSASKDEAAALGALARAFLESIQANPLTSDEGRQTDSHQTGGDLVLTRPRRPGVAGVPFVWLRSWTWQISWARDRA
jgi:hypothetical protein